MKKYFLLLSSLIYLLIFSSSYSQNFFPLRLNDELQELDYYHHYSTLGGSYTEINYPAFSISDSIIYNQMIFYNYNSEYLAYDSTDQKLFIYLSGGSHLAVDFNLPSGSTQVLYYGGVPRIWKSDGITNEIILGSIRKVFTMSSDTTYWQEPQGWFSKEWRTKIVEDIGPYYSYYYMNNINLNETETITTKHTIIFAQIDTNEINIYNHSIQLAEPVRDRYTDEFPYILPLNVTNPITGLISEFYAEYNVYRSDSLVFNRVFDIDTSTFLGFINIQPEELQEGDKIEFKCTLKDFSIFSNIRIIPDSGYYTFYIIPDTTTSVEPKKENIREFSLSQNYPNPFNPVTNIRYQIPNTSVVTLKIYDILGNKVATLVNEEKPAGSYSVEFDGSKLSSGIYYYRLIAGSYIATKKLILLK